MILGFKEGDFNFDQQQFDALLKCLHSNPEIAGKVYNKIFDRMLTYFRCNCCNHSQECATVVMNRIAKKIHEGVMIENEPIQYAIGFAKFVLREYQRWQRNPSEVYKSVIPEPLDDDEEYHNKLKKCLDKCLRVLPLEKTFLLKDYLFANSKRKLEIAKSLNITIESLRVKINRIKAELKGCIEDCSGGLQVA